MHLPVETLCLTCEEPKMCEFLYGQEAEAEAQSMDRSGSYSKAGKALNALLQNQQESLLQGFMGDSFRERHLKIPTE